VLEIGKSLKRKLIIKPAERKQGRKPKPKEPTSSGD
jgi:hypothetical protein